MCTYYHIANCVENRMSHAKMETRTRQKPQAQYAIKSPLQSLPPYIFQLSFSLRLKVIDNFESNQTCATIWKDKNLTTVPTTH